jgi:hypothetical protein
METKRVTVGVGVRVHREGQPYQNEQWDMNDYHNMILLKEIRHPNGRTVGEVVRTFIHDNGHVCAVCDLTWLEPFTEIVLWQTDTVCGRRVSYLQMYFI